MREKCSRRRPKTARLLGLTNNFRAALTFLCRVFSSSCGRFPFSLATLSSRAITAISSSPCFAAWEKYDKCPGWRLSKVPKTMTRDICLALLAHGPPESFHPIRLFPSKARAAEVAIGGGPEKAGLLEPELLDYFRRTEIKNCLDCF